MKKTITLVSVLALASLLILGSGVFLKSFVENKVHDAIAHSARPGTEISVEKVEFSPLYRQLSISNLRVNKKDGGETTSSYVGHAQATVPLRTMIACVPTLNDLFFAKGSNAERVALESIRADDLRRNAPDTRCKSASVVCPKASLSYPVFKKLLNGGSPSTDEIICALAIDRIESNGESATVQDEKDTITVTIKKDTAIDIRGPSVKEVNMSGVAVYASDSNALHVANCKISDIKIDRDLLKACLEVADKDEPSEADEERLKKLLIDNAPLFSSCLLTGVRIPRGESSIDVQELGLRWGESSPSAISLRMRSLCLPIDLLREELSFVPMPAGRRVLDIDLDHSFSGFTAKANKGLVRVKDFFGLSYAFTVIDSDSVKDVRLSFKDYAFTASLIGALPLDPMLSIMGVKVAAAEFCSKNTAEEKGVCNAIAQFIDAPGTLTIKSRPGTTLDLSSLRQCQNGQLGSLFEGKARPGSLSLIEQIKRLK